MSRTAQARNGRPWDNGNGGGEIPTTVTVTTYNPTNITSTEATCCADVTAENGSNIRELGVCWATSAYPTVENSHLSTTTWNKPFVCTISDLVPDTKYHVRAYALNGTSYVYGDDKIFTTLTEGGGGGQTYSITVEANPSTGGLVSGGGIYQQGQTCTVYAVANMGYSFENWTENGTICSIDQSCSFVVNGNRTFVANFTYDGGGSGDEDYVDLGLPSGLLWATRNVGANRPEDYGDYFAWGETQMKNTYDWSTYQYCMGSSHTLTKYCKKDSDGYNGYTDNLTVLLPEDDAATANWGSEWRMPTIEEGQELIDNCTSVWMTLNGVNGRCFTGPNGNTLFLPACGYYNENGLHHPDLIGGYWLSSLGPGSSNAPGSFSLSSDDFSTGGAPRKNGFSVRAVRED